MTKLLAILGYTACLTSALTLLPQQVGASPLFELVGDSQGMGGLQARTVPGGASASYFNPALLTDTPEGLQFGTVLLMQRIGISLDGRPGTLYDVPTGVGSATHADYSRFDDYPIPTSELQIGRKGDTQNEPLAARPRQGAGTGHQNYWYLGFGLVVKAFKDRLALGVNGLLAVPKFTTLQAFYSDEREQFYSNSLHPELYGYRLTAPSIAFAGAFKVTEDLSLGIGATLNISTPAVAQTHVSDFNNLDKLTLDIKAPVTISLAPHFGGSYTLARKRLRLSATAHAPTKVAVGANFSFLIGNGQEDSSKAQFVLDYMPWRVAFGAAFDVVNGPGQTLTVAGTLTYARWSTYVDRHGERPTPAYAWSDILSPTLGVRWKEARSQIAELQRAAARDDVAVLQDEIVGLVTGDRAGARGAPRCRSGRRFLGGARGATA